MPCCLPSLTKPLKENCEGKEGCNRVLEKGRSAITFWEEGGMRSRFDGMRGCDRVLVDEGGVRSRFGGY